MFMILFHTNRINATSLAQRNALVWLHFMAQKAVETVNASTAFA